MGHRPQTAAHPDLETAPIPAVVPAGGGHKTQIVHIDQTTGRMLAAGESYLELTAKVLGIRMAQQKTGGGVGIGGGIEGLPPADPGQRTGGDVAHRIAAGLPGGNTHRRQPAHQVRGIVDMDIVKLDILAGGDMGDSIGILLGRIRQYLQLFGGQAAEGDLDAHHPRGIPQGFGPLEQLPAGKGQGAGLHSVVALAVVVTLTVDTPPQPGLGKQLILHLALALKNQLIFENIDLLGQIPGHLPGEAVFPGAHGLPPSKNEPSAPTGPAVGGETSIGSYAYEGLFRDKFIR